MVLGCGIYLAASEFISAKKSKGEVLLFRRGRIPYVSKASDEEAKSDDRMTAATVTRAKTVPDAPSSIQKQTAIFHWDDVHYDIKIKGEPRKLLDGVDGWVKPGTLTALMVSFIIISLPRLSDLIILGCLWCWKDHSSRCSCITCNHGCGHRTNARRRTTKRYWFSEKDRLCPTAGSPFGHIYG